MPAIYFTDYSSGSMSPSEINNKEHLLGRELLKAALFRSCGLVIKDGDIAVHPSGKPYLGGMPGIHFNISHCDALVVCAIDDFPLGIDAERIGYFPKILIKRALSDRERLYFEKMTAEAFDPEELFYRFWTLKEAYVKLSGKGVDTDLKAFSFSFPDLSASASHDSMESKMGSSMESNMEFKSALNASTEVLCSDPKVSCFQAKLESGHLISLCMSGRRPPVILSRCRIQ